MGSWHIFLPSEVCSGIFRSAGVCNDVLLSAAIVFYTIDSVCIIEVFQHISLWQESLYWAVSWKTWGGLATTKVLQENNNPDRIWHKWFVKVLEMFWDHQRDTDFFKNHPILSNPVPWYRRTLHIFAFHVWWSLQIDAHWGHGFVQMHTTYFSWRWWWKPSTEEFHGDIVCISFDSQITMGLQISPLLCRQCKGMFQHLWHTGLLVGLEFCGVSWGKVA